MKETQTLKAVVADLMRLMTEHADLPVVPMVDGAIAGDDWGYWLGSFRSIRVDEYLLTDCNIQFRSDDDVFEVLEAYLPSDEFDKLPESEEGCRPYYDKLPWKKAIVVFVDEPTKDDIC